MKVYSDFDDALIEVSESRPFPVKDVHFAARVTARTFQVVVSSSTATQIAGYNPRRKSLLIANITGTQQAFCGTDATVSLTTGALLGAAAAATLAFTTPSAIFGLSAVGAQTVAVLEETYDIEPGMQ